MASMRASLAAALMAAMAAISPVKGASADGRAPADISQSGAALVDGNSGADDLAYGDPTVMLDDLFRDVARLQQDSKTVFTLVDRDAKQGVMVEVDADGKVIDFNVVPLRPEILQKIDFKNLKYLSMMPGVTAMRIHPDLTAKNMAVLTVQMGNSGAGEVHLKSVRLPMTKEMWSYFNDKEQLYGQGYKANDKVFTLTNTEEDILPELKDDTIVQVGNQIVVDGVTYTLPKNSSPALKNGQKLKPSGLFSAFSSAKNPLNSPTYHLLTGDTCLASNPVSGNMYAVRCGALPTAVQARLKTEASVLEKDPKAVFGFSNYGFFLNINLPVTDPKFYQDALDDKPAKVVIKMQKIAMPYGDDAIIQATKDEVQRRYSGMVKSGVLTPDQAGSLNERATGMIARYSGTPPKKSETPRVNFNSINPTTPTTPTTPITPITSMTP